MTSTRLLFLATCLGLVLATGCASNGSGSRGRTEVTIYGQELGDIRSVAIAVFQDQEFDLTGATRNELVFQRKGSTWDDVVHGTWMDDGIWERVTVSIQSEGPDIWLLEARATMVRDPDRGFFEEEKPVSRLGHKPYQNLLEEIKSRLL